MRQLSLIVLLLLACSVSHSQITPAADSTGRDTATGRLLPDSLRISAADTALGGYHQSKRPWVAVGLSAVLPGAGQIYDHAYWKLPIIWGLGGYWVSQWIQMNSKYKDYRDLYSGSLLTSPPYGDTHLKNVRDFYRDERDKFAWYLGLFYLLNLVDAYVGANLYDFDVGPDLGTVGRPPQTAVTIRWRF